MWPRDLGEAIVWGAILVYPIAVWFTIKRLDTPWYLAWFIGFFVAGMISATLSWLIPLLCIGGIVSIFTKDK